MIKFFIEQSIDYFGKIAQTRWVQELNFLFFQIRKQKFQKIKIFQIIFMFIFIFIFIFVGSSILIDVFTFSPMIISFNFFSSSFSLWMFSKISSFFSLLFTGEIFKSDKKFSSSISSSLMSLFSPKQTSSFSHLLSSFTVLGGGLKKSSIKPSNSYEKISLEKKEYLIFKLY